MTPIDIAAFLGRLDKAQESIQKCYEDEPDHLITIRPKFVLDAITVIRTQQTELDELRRAAVDLSYPAIPGCGCPVCETRRKHINTVIQAQEALKNEPTKPCI